MLSVIGKLSFRPGVRSQRHQTRQYEDAALGHYTVWPLLYYCVVASLAESSKLDILPIPKQRCQYQTQLCLSFTSHQNVLAEKNPPVIALVFASIVRATAHLQWTLEPLMRKPMEIPMNDPLQILRCI